MSSRDLIAGKASPKLFPSFVSPQAGPVADVTIIEKLVNDVRSSPTCDLAPFGPSLDLCLRKRRFYV